MLKQKPKEPFLGGRHFPLQKNDPYLGKVRDVYYLGDLVLMIATDKISAFDHILPFEVLGKGVILNQITEHFLRATEDIIPNWLIYSPNPRVLLGHRCEQVMVEMVVREYFEGSIVAPYNEGQRKFWGYTLPEGLKPGDKLPEIMVTPTTKALIGHDESITREEIIEAGLLSAEDYDFLHETSIKIFNRGQQMAKERGLILVDTKYEFGRRKGTLMLTDEIHTPDSSRYYYLDGYEERQKNHEPQKQLSKEFVRVWLKENGFEGKTGQKIPQIPADFPVKVSERYQELYRTLMGKDVSRDHILLANDTEVVYKDAMIGITGSFHHTTPLIGIIMGSNSDLAVMKKAADMCKKFDVTYELTVVSAHRTPDRLKEYCNSAKSRGLLSIIAGAGGAAHLPGMAAAQTVLPVYGVPIKSSNSIDGWDSMLSILQMPKGVPVATVAIDASDNAVLLAIKNLALVYPYYAERIAQYKDEELIDAVDKMVKEVREEYPNQFDKKQ